MNGISSGEIGRLRQLCVNSTICSDKATDGGASHIFLNIIKKTGEEIRGNLYASSYYYIGIREEVLKTTDPRNWSRKWIAIDDIASYVLLDSSYPPKLACDWNHKKSKEEVLLLEVELAADQYGRERVTGQLKGANVEGVDSGYLFPCSFSILTDPYKRITDSFCFENIHSIRKLPYTPESIRTLETDKNREISQFLLTTLPKELISITTDYLLGTLPDELPKPFYDLLVSYDVKDNKSSDESTKIVIAAGKGKKRKKTANVKEISSEKSTRKKERVAY